MVTWDLKFLVLPFIRRQFECGRMQTDLILLDVSTTDEDLRLSVRIILHVDAILLGLELDLLAVQDKLSSVSSWGGQVVH